MAAAAVAASGFVSLGTTDCSELYTVSATTEVFFSPTDAEHEVWVRVSPTWFYSLELTADANVRLTLVEPALRTGGTGSAGSTGGTGGLPTSAGATSGAGGASGSAGATSAASEEPAPGAPRVVVSPGSDAVEYRFRVERGSDTGAFSTRVEAVLGVMAGCDDYRPKQMELRIGSTN
jgi:hypothetical protein